MVYIEEDRTEEVTDSYMKVEDGTEFAVVECDDGYFIYKIPVTDAPSYADVGGKTLDFATSKMKIIEAPNQSNESIHDGHSALTVPQKVVDEAHKISDAVPLE